MPSYLQGMVEEPAHIRRLVKLEKPVGTSARPWIIRIDREKRSEVEGAIASCAGVERQMCCQQFCWTVRGPEKFVFHADGDDIIINYGIAEDMLHLEIWCCNERYAAARRLVNSLLSIDTSICVTQPDFLGQ